MTDYTHVIKINDDSIIETVQAENACIADSVIGKKYPNTEIDCIEYEDIGD